MTTKKLFRFIASVILAARILSSANAVAGDPKLAACDVTWLWPVPATEDQLDGVIAISGLNADDGSAAWSDEQFEDVLRIADSDAAQVGDHRIRLNDSIRSKGVWRVVAFRVDPTAPGGHEIIRNNIGEKPQLRIVLQPVTVEDDRIEIHDVAVHLVYSFVIPGGDGTAEQPDRDHFRSIIRDLDELKTIVEDAGVHTSGAPLGVHPGLTQNVPGLREKVRQFLSRHLHASRLSAMAIMGLDGPEPWIFVAMAKFPPGAERFGAIPFLPAEMLSFRSGGGAVSPSPRVNNLNPVPNRLVMPVDGKDRRGVATAALFEDAAFDADAFAIVGIDDNGELVRDDRVRNGDIPDLIADPIRSHFFNTDCVSCHTETRRRLRLDLPVSPLAFLQDGQPPRIDPDVLPKDDWNVRNLGWFPPFRFIGGGPPVATVTQRTANETAEVVDFIERQYRHDPSPGPGNETDAAAGDSNASGAAEPGAAPEHVQHLDQGWTAEERQDFYFLGQGSQLLPYAWFVCLELPDSEELLRSPRHMRSLGCIVPPPDEGRNPDGLPIGFVRDSNSATIAMKAGLLGSRFDREQYPPTNDWLGLTCAACHTSEFTYEGRTIRIDGGAAMTDMESFLAVLAKSLRAAADDDEKFRRFEARIRERAGGHIDTVGLREELRSYAPVIERLVERNKSDHPYGRGRLDAFGAILNQICEASLGIPENHRPSSAPVSYPFLWDTPHLDWVQWNSSVDIPISRNVGEVLGVFAHVNLTGEPGGDQFRSSARVDYLHRLETQLTRLRAPEWPTQHLGAIDEAKAAAGKRLFAANCAGCHNVRDDRGNFAMTDPNEFGRSFIKTTSIPFRDIGTDPQMVVNFVTRTAQPGALKHVLEPVLNDPATQASLEELAKLVAAMGRPRPDFSREVPAGMVLAAAVRGVLGVDLAERFQNLSEGEREQMLLELHGRRIGESPPHAGAGYKARPLNGVWATAPFGHAGAVPNLYQWLLPEDERVISFFVGNREFDPVHVGYRLGPSDGAFHFNTARDDGTPIAGNSNKGHTGPGKTDFTEEERWQIIEYLKTLR
jgi:hypothetical protein